MDRLKRELGKLELSTTGTKNELQRRLREQLQLQGIDIESYEFEYAEVREIQAPLSPSGVDINLLLVVMMEKTEVTNQKLFEASRAENQKLLELRTRSYLKLLEPKTKNFTQLFCQKFKRSSKQHLESYRKSMSQSAEESLMSRKGCHI